MATDKKENRDTKHEKCSEDFSDNPILDHRQESNELLNEFEINRDLIQRSINQQKTEAKIHPLIQEIDQWEIEAINKIKQIAKENRNLLLSFTGAQINQIESKLNNITSRLNQSRQENDFMENYLVEWNQQLVQYKEELIKLSNIKIKYDSTPFVTQIHIDIPVLDQGTIPDQYVNYQNLAAASKASEQKLKYFTAGKSESLMNVPNVDKKVQPVIVGPNEGHHFQALAVANSERVIRLGGSQTDGKITIMEGEILMGEGPPLHIHHREDEYWYVLEGEIEFQVGEEKFIGKAGTWVFGPRSIKHGFRNVNSPGARLQFIFQPAGIEHYFEEISRVIVAHEPGWEDQATAVATKYGIEVVGTPNWSKPDWS